MKTYFSQLSPGRLLLVVLLGSFLVAALAIWYELQVSWFGLRLAATEQGVVVISSQAPAEAIPAGARVLALIADGRRTDILPADLIDDPDGFASYLEMNEFFHRQGLMYASLQAPVGIVWKKDDSGEVTTLVHPQKRAMVDVPFIFWFSLLTGITACLIGCWVWGLRRHDWGARMYAMTGCMFFATTIPLAIYTTRPLALNGQTFKVLSAVNHFTVLIFGCALVGLFLTYPRMLIKPRTLLWLPLIYSLWWLGDVTQTLPDLDWGARISVMSQLVLAVLFAVVQWRSCRSRPVEQAALRWFLLSVLPACFLTVMPILVFTMFGHVPILHPATGIQYPAIALSTLLVMYLGIAMGLSRYRLFELDEWAYRILLWVGGAATVILLDGLFIFLLKPDPTLSLGLTLVVAGLLYFPARQWLWLRYVSPTQMSIEQAMPELIRIAFIDLERERDRQWDNLLNAVYRPLEMSHLQANVTQARLENDGLELVVPACGGLSARAMQYAQQGHRLFSTRDIVFVRALCVLMEHAAAGRVAYEQGATQERKRISRDMHDDVGARLLMLMHRAKDEPTAEVARAAMRDLRTALNSMDAKTAQLEDALADWRMEAETRCEAANVLLEWHTSIAFSECSLSPQEKSTLERVLREMLSNVLKHAAPQSVKVEIAYDQVTLHIQMSNQVHQDTSDQWKEGRGMRNMRARLAEIGGTLHVFHQNHRNVVALSLPLGRS